MKKTLKHFQKNQIENLSMIKGGQQKGQASSSQKSKHSQADDVVTEEITFVVEDLQIA